MLNGSLAAMKIPKPSAGFVANQNEYVGLLKHQGRFERRKELERSMEAEFMKAWRLSPDLRRKAAKLKGALLPNDSKYAGILDHCTYYFSADRFAPVIVTQPYFDCVKELSELLPLGPWSVPEVINATEWGFYYPGKAHLHIIFFPHRYAEASAALKRALR